MVSCSIRTITLAALLALVPAACGSAPAPVDAAAQGFRLGPLRLVALRDMLNVVPNDGSVFGKNADPGAVAAVLRQAGAPADKITLGVDALLVLEPGRVILLDTGLGPRVGGALLKSLAKAGIAPGQVTDVLITHSHGDHVGGLGTADGRLAFPNATIRMSAAEWGWMQAQPQSASIARTIGSRVKTFQPGETVAPGIRAVPIPGHTPGHSGYEIGAGKAQLLDIGDTAHSAIVSLVRPDWTIGYDQDAAAGRASREALLAKLAASGEWVFAPHFPFPGVGHIVRQGSGFAWRPGLP